MYISTKGSNDELLNFLENRRLTVSFEDIAWRMKDPAFFNFFGVKDNIMVSNALHTYQAGVGAALGNYYVRDYWIDH